MTADTFAVSVFVCVCVLAALPDGRTTLDLSLLCVCIVYRCVCMCETDTLTPYFVKREALVEGNVASQLSIMSHGQTLPHTQTPIY